MKTKTIVEGILYASGNNPIVRTCFEICHVINEKDRNWESRPHVELFYLDNFKTPSFLMIVDKQLHVYIIGDKAKGRTYNIINIEGFFAEHYTMSKTNLRSKIYQEAKDSAKNLYLPECLCQRIIFINPNYKTNILKEEDIYIFNRQGIKGTLFTKSTWSIGIDMYSVNQPEYETTAGDILKAIFTEIV